MTTRSFTATYDDIYDDDNLTGNEKFHLDILHRFYNKEKGYARPSLKQIMKKASSKNERQTRKVLNSLSEKGYIKIVATVGVGTKYYLLKNYMVAPGNNDSKPLAKLIDKKEYINNNKNNNINTSEKASKNKKKHKYGEYKNVLLTDEEKERLIQELGEYKFNLCIKKLDEGIELKGYKYRSHNMAIRKWVIDAVKKDLEKSKAHDPVEEKTKSEIIDGYEYETI